MVAPFHLPLGTESWSFQDYPVNFDRSRTPWRFLLSNQIVEKSKRAFSRVWVLNCTTGRLFVST